MSNQVNAANHASFNDVIIKQSKIGQFEDGLGCFAKRDFKKGEIVIAWKLKILSEEQFNTLTKYERLNFTHMRNGIRYLYPAPERYVNRSSHPNVYPDFDRKANIAMRDIKKDEELSIAANTIEDF